MIDLTGPQRVLEDPEPPVTGRRARHGDRDRRDDTPDEPEAGRRVAARRSREPEPEDEGTAPRSRRRVGWRKGSDVDEEMWPIAAFGGVSDEQFWDDLASDKPLATTARTAQPEPGPKRRPPNAGPLPDLYPAGDRTAVQPTQPPQSAQAGVQPSAAATAATQAYPAMTQPSPTATQPVRAARQPAEPRGRPRAGSSADEDPLTSPAYSLRPRGSVDGRAYPPSHRSRDQYESASQETQAFSRADAQAAGGGYPDGVPPFRSSDRPAHGTNGHGRSDGHRPEPPRADPPRPDRLRADPLRSGGTVPSGAYRYPQQPYGEPAKSINPVDTPANGEPYGYAKPAGSRAQPGPGGEPRRGARPAGPPANGYRGPYDPQGYDRRLTSMP